MAILKLAGKYEVQSSGLKYLASFQSFGSTLVGNYPAFYYSVGDTGTSFRVRMLRPNYGSLSDDNTYPCPVCMDSNNGMYVDMSQIEPPTTFDLSRMFTAGWEPATSVSFSYDSSTGKWTITDIQRPASLYGVFELGSIGSGKPVLSNSNRTATFATSTRMMLKSVSASLIQSSDLSSLPQSDCTIKGTYQLLVGDGTRSYVIYA